jgi:thioredoxin 1
MSASASTPADIDALVAGRDRTVLVDCYTPGCGPCAALAPVLDELATEMAGQLEVVKVDVAATPGVARRFGVRSVPTLLLFRDGALKATRSGAASRTQLLTWLSANGQLERWRPGFKRTTQA